MENLKPDKIMCVGRNYLKHAIELGNEVPREPLYFIKPASTLCLITDEQKTLELPKTKGEVHHELELVLRISRQGDQLSFSHFAFGLDLTLRDLQNQMKKAGQPWEKAKVFRNSSVLGPWMTMTTLAEVMVRPFELTVNGQVRQKGQGQDMSWKPDFLLEDLPNWFPVCDGDLIYTGTPEGVGPLKLGDLVRVRSEDYSYSFECS